MTILIEIFILSCTFYHLKNKREKEISHASSTPTFIGDPGAIWLLIVFHFQHIDWLVLPCKTCTCILVMRIFSIGKCDCFPHCCKEIVCFTFILFCVTYSTSKFILQLFAWMKKRVSHSLECQIDNRWQLPFLINKLYADVCDHLAFF